ncbi:unsaturated chondroitin disaccharide hydrolase [Lachnotalea glycerini]|uniref:Glycosyl hydrolase family 88 n=1 Tax=Lachnotalea glycerini TaxID=1763509 RepID=A0A255IRG5_9FIRM|nr:glycoside hydrolase family 88 protein [Lachnotalea glycerini]PXV87767.1 unsaturated chondroitin disaccharide hydrolase [Lachnotalea glycerini]RDY32067.1 glycosyl hydrolase family 88 [Lachnotalea glycerini]
MLQEKDIKWVESVIEKINRKLNWVSEKSKDKIPYTTMNGIHDNYNNSEREFRRTDGLNWWTNGFWGGMMWLMYHETKEEKYAEIAKFSEKKLDWCFDDYLGLHHDVGFMWLLTAVADYRITQNPESKKRGLHAANLLAGRFNPVGKFIRAWNSIGSDDTTGWAIIDCMMNIPLLYWAFEVTGDPRFQHIATQHANTVMEYFIRPDGSSEHIVEFDPLQGGFVKTHGGQGYENGSSWTRGQSWALYGFILSYIHTGHIEYLNTAKRVAHYFISNIPESGIIPVDFRQPKEPAWEDSTAAAIASCGLIEIAKQVNTMEKDLYLSAALKLLRVLDDRRCNWSKDCDCILENCTEAYHSKEHHINIIYGDYFFMEAIFKLKENNILLW